MPHLGCCIQIGGISLELTVRRFSGTVPGSFRNTDVENQEPSRARSQKDPLSEVEFSACRAIKVIHSDPDETSHVVTRVEEGIPSRSPRTSSGKQKKARSKSQPQFRSENTPATLEEDQILLGLRRLAKSGSSANFNNNIIRISKLPKSLTTTMLIFDEKSEKFKSLEDLFQMILENHNQLTEKDRIHYFHSLMRVDALQTFKNISSPSRENLAEILTVFRCKKRKTPVIGFGETQISAFSFQSCQPVVN